jgi:hypothetical protein
VRIAFEHDIEDIVAFMEFIHQKRGSYQTAYYTVSFIAGLVVLLAAYPFATDTQHSYAVRLAIAIAFSGIFAGGLIYWIPRSAEAQVRGYYQDDLSNPYLFGRREMEITQDALTEKTPVGESRIVWHAIQFIEESDEHFYFFPAKNAAHIVPKLKVLDGDIRAFVARAKELWKAAHPESSIARSP